jgi:creatinine amidohydrolase
MEAFTETGIIGRPSLASAIKGKAILASLASSFGDHMRTIRA